MKNQRTQIIVEIALCVALSTALNFVAMRLPLNIAGGSISLTMLPIAVIALRRGPLIGALAGAAFGVIDLLMDPYIFVPAQVMLDYPVPYLLLGLGVGVFSSAYNARKPVQLSDGKKAPSRLLAMRSTVTILALVVGGALRFISHLFSGVVFFAEYAGGQNVWIYSAVYNISYLAPSLAAVAVCALIVMPVLDSAAPVS